MVIEHMYDVNSGHRLIAPTIYNGGIRAIYPGNLSEFGEMSA